MINPWNIIYCSSFYKDKERCIFIDIHRYCTYLIQQDGYMSSEQISLAKGQLYSLLCEVRKEAVPLVDAFDFPDQLLNSALGRYDGDVYTHLYQWAQRAPRNKKQVSLANLSSSYCHS